MTTCILGLIARAEDTGLGRLSWEAQRFLDPEHVVIADCRHPLGNHPERFPGAEIADPLTPAYEDAVKRLLDYIDVLLVLETPYDPRVYTWAKERHVTTACLAMPEYDIPERWKADHVFNPTSYLLDRLPTRSTVFPWPIDTDSITYRPRTHIDTWLHIVGQPCQNDRNGTQLVIEAFRRLPHRRLIVRSQTPIHQRGATKNIEFRVGNVAHQSDLYQDGDALIYPRRYAGLSLPMNEAQAAGLPLVVLDRQPEATWTPPSARIPAFVKKRWQVRRGSKRDATPSTEETSPLDVYDAKVEDVISTIERISDDNDLVTTLSDYSRQRAESLSWQNIGHVWRQFLRSACRS